MPVDSPFVVRVAARGYEIDVNGHVAASVLLQYAQHARWECLRAAGIDQSALVGHGIGPVSLEERIRFHREVRAGVELDVSRVFVWGEGKSFRVEQEIRIADGTLAAAVTSIGGLLDLGERHLIATPGQIWRSAASSPEVLGLRASTEDTQNWGSGPPAAARSRRSGHRPRGRGRDHFGVLLPGAA